MGIRVIKTAAASIAAIYTAIYLGLEPPLSAGILAILGVEVTRMKGLKSALSRFVASVLGLFIASLIFMIFGFKHWAVAIFILVAFPIIARFKLKDGIVTSAVIVFQLFNFGEITVHTISNGLLMLLVGLGWATVINFIYMPKDEKLIVVLRNEVEQNFGIIFKEMANTLRNPKHIWNGSELLDAHRAIDDGSIRALRNRENRPWDYETYWITYFGMRRQQLDTIQQMLSELALVYDKLPQAESIAQMLEQLANDVKADVYQGLAEQGVFRLMVDFRALELPKTKEEFELRAALLTLLHEVDRYLAIAKKLKKKAISTKKEVS